MHSGFAAILATMVGVPTVAAQPPRTGGEQALEQRPVRVAVLNLGPTDHTGAPASEAMIGLHVTAQDFRDALPLLDEDRVNVVVIRVWSWGGKGAEAVAFDEVFAREYAPWFRTVAWVHHASGATTRAIWGIGDLYMAPGATLGTALDWGEGHRFGPEPPEDERVRMRAVSLRVGRDPAIIRSMMFPTGLSVDADPAGRFIWRQDALGSSVLCPQRRILRLDAATAVRYEIARAVASSREELALAMGLASVEWAGQSAAALIDERRNERREAVARLTEAVDEYSRAIQSARMAGDELARGERVARARACLDRLRSLFSGESIVVDVVVGSSLARREEWVREQIAVLEAIERDAVPEIKK